MSSWKAFLSPVAQKANCPKSVFLWWIWIQCQRTRPFALANKCFRNFSNVEGHFLLRFWLSSCASTRSVFTKCKAYAYPLWRLQTNLLKSLLLPLKREKLAKRLSSWSWGAQGSPSARSPKWNSPGTDFHGNPRIHHPQVLGQRLSHQWLQTAPGVTSLRSQIAMQTQTQTQAPKHPPHPFHLAKMSILTQQSMPNKRRRKQKQLKRTTWKSKSTGRQGLQQDQKQHHPRQSPRLLAGSLFAMHTSGCATLVFKSLADSHAADSVYSQFRSSAPAWQLRFPEQNLLPGYIALAYPSTWQKSNWTLARQLISSFLGRKRLQPKATSHVSVVILQILSRTSCTWGPASPTRQIPPPLPAPDCKPWIPSPIANRWPIET